MSCPSLPTLHDKASGGAGQCKGNKTIRVFTKTLKEYQNRLTKADIIKNELRTFVFVRQRKNGPALSGADHRRQWCRPSSAEVPTIVGSTAHHRQQPNIY